MKHEGLYQSKATLDHALPISLLQSLKKKTVRSTQASFPPVSVKPGSTCDANANARANNVHTSNANSRKARHAGAVKDSQTFSKIADEGKALAAISLPLAAVF